MSDTLLVLHFLRAESSALDALHRRVQERRLRHGSAGVDHVDLYRSQDEEGLWLAAEVRRSGFADDGSAWANAEGWHPVETKTYELIGRVAGPARAGRSEVGVVAYDDAQPERAEEIEAVFLDLVTKLQGDAARFGIINLDVGRDPTNPHLFVFYENWTSRATWDAFNRPDSPAPYIGDLYRRWASLDIAQRRTVWTMVSEDPVR